MKKSNPTIKAQILRSTFYVLLVLSICAIPFALAKRSFDGRTTSATLSGQIQRTLTFADRVAYQRAIEDVYWRHRIWPKENLKPKPSLDEVMSSAQVEQKAEDYLRDSQALEVYWQKPIAPKQLQAEMERMARDTKQPEVLRELFEALGNDPFVIAECLARRVLAERLIGDLTNSKHLATAGGLPLFSAHDSARSAVAPYQTITTLGTATYVLPEISNPDGCIDDTWTATSLANAPSARSGHTAVWTGTEMIVWGGTPGSGYLNTGGRYNPSTDSWTATGTTNAPSARYVHTAVWTGSEMIVWGGLGTGGIPLNTGGRYDPGADSWTASSTNNAPSARIAPAVWTGSEMIVWGGSGNGGYFITGGRYNPSTDSWTATSTANAPTARSGHTAVWTGSEMIVWGGSFCSPCMDFNTGGRYDPGTDTWVATSTSNAPAARFDQAAVWTGSQMIVWGGVAFPDTLFNTGGRYTPDADSWTPTSTTNAPFARDVPTAVWAGTEMIVWGGSDSNGSQLNTGGRYDAAMDSWTATSITNAPTARTSHTAVWTASEMIVWGGANGGVRFNTGGRYCAQSGATPTPTATPTATFTPTPRPSPSPRPRPTPAPRP